MPDELIEFAGRSHLVLLHMPIGLVLCALAAEIVIGPVERAKRRRVEELEDSPRGWRRPGTVALGMLAFGTLGAMAAAGTGWLHGEGYGPRVDLHRWLGIGAASAVLVTLVLGFVAMGVGSRATLNWYRLLLLVSAVGTGVAGHFGGDLVHGDGYVYAPLAGLFQSDADEPVAAEVEAEVVDAVFALDVLPILQRSCVQCHGPDEQRSGFRLDTRAHVLESGTVVPGDTLFSEIVARIELPADDPDVMPPLGTAPQLSADEVAVVVGWIEGLE